MKISSLDHGLEPPGARRYLMQQHAGESRRQDFGAEAEMQAIARVRLVRINVSVRAPVQHALVDDGHGVWVEPRGRAEQCYRPRVSREKGRIVDLVIHVEFHVVEGGGFEAVCPLGIARDAERGAPTRRLRLPEDVESPAGDCRRVARCRCAGRRRV